MEQHIKGLLIFKIFTGRLPKVKADEYVRNFKKNIMENIKLPEYISWIGVPCSIEGTFVEYIKFEENDFDKNKIEQSIIENMTTLEDDAYKDQLVNVRISKEEKDKLLEKSESLGFKSLSEYLRFSALNAIVDVKLDKPI